MPEIENQQPEQQPEAPKGQEISHQVLSLARMIDRLPPGDYAVMLEKQIVERKWRAVVLSGADVVRVMDLWR